MYTCTHSCTCTDGLRGTVQSQWSVSNSACSACKTLQCCSVSVWQAVYGDIEQWKARLPQEGCQQHNLWPLLLLLLLLLLLPSSLLTSFSSFLLFLSGFPSACCHLATLLCLTCALSVSPVSDFFFFFTSSLLSPAPPPPPHSPLPPPAVLCPTSLCRAARRLVQYCLCVALLSIFLFPLKCRCLCFYARLVFCEVSSQLTPLKYAVPRVLLFIVFLWVHVYLLWGCFVFFLIVIKYVLFKHHKVWWIRLAEWL